MALPTACQQLKVSALGKPKSDDAMAKRRENELRGIGISRIHAAVLFMGKAVKRPATPLRYRPGSLESLIRCPAYWTAWRSKA